MHLEPTSDLLADAAVCGEAGPGRRPKLTPQEGMAVAGVVREKILALMAKRKSLPSGLASRKQRLSLGTQIFQLRHPSKVLSPEKAAETKRRWVERNREKKKQVALAWYYRNRGPLKIRVLKMTESAIRIRRLRAKSIQFALACRLRVTMRRALHRQFVKKSARTFSRRTAPAHRAPLPARHVLGEPSPLARGPYPPARIFPASRSGSTAAGVPLLKSPTTLGRGQPPQGQEKSRRPSPVGGNCLNCRMTQ